MKTLRKAQEFGTDFVDPQGSKANSNGMRLENLVEEELVKYGITSLQYSDFVNGDLTAPIPGSDKGVLFKNVPYTNVYGANGRGEFLLFLRGIPDIRIECRSQTVAGSVDEKLPYLLENCKIFDEKNVIVVLEGNGFKTKAKEWFIENAHAVKSKNINVMSLKEFKNWIKGIFA